jgi:hypothetical protein
VKSSGFFAAMQIAAAVLLFAFAGTEGKTTASSTPNGGVFAYEIHQDTMADKYYADEFGPIPLSGAPGCTVNIPLAGNFAANSPLSMPTMPLTLRWLYHVELSNASQYLAISIENNSAADFSIVQIAVGSVGTATINNLPHNSVGTAQCDAHGKTLDSMVSITASCTPSASGTFGAADKLAAAFSLNGLVANKVVVLDSMFAGYQRIFTNEYNIANALNLDYLDIRNGFFEYWITNHTGIELVLSVVHRNLWLSDFCRARNPQVRSASDLTGLSFIDSVNAFDGDIAARVQLFAQSTNAFNKFNISGTRLFPEWDQSDSQSVTKIDYVVNMGVFGRRITLAASDSISFVIKTHSFKFNDMSGTVMDALAMPGDSVTIPVPSSWTAGSGRFVFDVSSTIKMPDSARLDTLVASQTILAPVNPTVSCQWDTVFAPVANNAVIKGQTDFSGVFRLNPDSLRITGNVGIPAGSHVVLMNDLTDTADPSYFKYMGLMKIRDSLVFAPSAGVLRERAAPGRFACEALFPVLKYSVPVACRVSAEWLDMRGRLVYSYVNRWAGPGSYAVPVPAASWPGGVYCMVFRAGNFETKGKIVVVR